MLKVLKDPLDFHLHHVLGIRYEKSKIKGSQSILFLESMSERVGSDIIRTNLNLRDACSRKGQLERTRSWKF